MIIDLGRPDRVLNVIIYGRWQSPIIWDVLAITTYLTASVAYLFLPMIPDLALFRDRLAGRVSGWRLRLYDLLSVRWQGTAAQWRYMGGAITTAMILIIPIAVSVHTVVSWIFAMTLREPWNSTIFGAFFVAGAIFSGVGTLIVVMAVLRKVYHLEEYITEKHFVYLGYLMAAFALIMIYGNISEYLTTGYKMEEGAEFHFRQLFLASVRGVLLVLPDRRPGDTGAADPDALDEEHLGYSGCGGPGGRGDVGGAVLHRRGRLPGAAHALRAVDLRADLGGAVGDGRGVRPVRTLDHDIRQSLPHHRCLGGGGRPGRP